MGKIVETLNVEGTIYTFGASSYISSAGSTAEMLTEKAIVVRARNLVTVDIVP